MNLKVGDIDTFCGKEVAKLRYRYAPHRRHWGVWVYYTYSDGTEGMGGNFVKTCITKREAERFCYCMNGWKKKVEDYAADFPAIKVVSRNLGNITLKGKWIIVRVTNDDSPNVFGTDRMEVLMTSAENDGPVGRCNGKGTAYDYGLLRIDTLDGITVLVIGKDDFVYREEDFYNQRFI